MGRLDGKCIVITGAAAGMGEAIAELFVKEGANIVAMDRSEDKLNEYVEKLNAMGPGKAVAYVGDMSIKEDCEGMIDKCVEAYGNFTTLVNNAGIMDDNAAVGDMSDEMLDRLMAVNAIGPIYAMRKAVNTFFALHPDHEDDDGEIGNIINTTSVGAVHQTAGCAYAASKAALWQVTKNTAYMYMHKGIRCNALSPGGIITDLPATMPKPNEFGFERTGELLVHSGELGMPEDIANAMLFLASDESRFVNGIVVTVDGGWTNL